MIEDLDLNFIEVFNTPAGRIVLKELVRFAEADNADFIADVRKSDYIQGRRSVVMEIKKHLSKGEKNERSS